MKYSRFTPEGMRDLLFEECEIKRRIENDLVALLSGRGFREVITPSLEYYDVFGRAVHTPMETMYKLTGRHGRLLVMRPDSTPPISRLYFSKLCKQPLPVRLFYSQNVFRMNQGLCGRSDEIFEFGIEVIGAKGRLAELEVITLAMEALELAGVRDYKIELGHSGLFDDIFEAVDADELLKEGMRTSIEQKNYSALSDYLEQLPQTDQTKLLRVLPRLFGGREVLKTARELFHDSGAAERLNYIEEVYIELEKAGLKDKLIIDLGLVNRNEYYTGVLFRGYIEGTGESILSGGCYNMTGYQTEAVPAIGFSVNLTEIVGYLFSKDRKSYSVDLLIFAESGHEIEAVEVIKDFTKKGYRCELGLSDDVNQMIETANRKNIKNIISVKNGIKVVRGEI